MKQLYLFLLLLDVIKFVGAAKDYHGNRRYWTLENSAGETNIALNLLNEPVKIIFPRMTFSEISPVILLRSLLTDQCKTSNSILKFKLEFNDINFIRGEVKTFRIMIRAYSYDGCGFDPDPYNVARIDQTPAVFIGQSGCEGFLIKPYAKDDTKNEIVLNVLSSSECPTFIILPKYMFVEDAPPLPEDIRLPLNDSFAGHEDGFWWKSGNDPFLPDGISFVGINAQIDILQSTKSKPYFSIQIWRNLYRSHF